MRLLIILSVNIFFLQKAYAQFFFHHTIGAGVITADVTPDAVDWNNMHAASDCAIVYGNTQTITGISTSIDLEVENTNYAFYISYQIDGGAWSSPIGGTATINGISSGTTLRFKVDGLSGPTTLIIKNASDGNAILDTISVTRGAVICP